MYYVSHKHEDASLLRRLLFSWDKSSDNKSSKLLNGRIINLFWDWTVDLILPALSDNNYYNEKYILNLQLVR